MKLGDVLKKERKRAGLSIGDMADRLGVDEGTYRSAERGRSDAEVWGPYLAELAVALEVPVSRLLAASGRTKDTRPGQAGKLIAEHRRRRELTAEDLAASAGIALDDLQRIEAGSSPIEEVGPRLLRFAEVIEQPVFNLFYPAGLPFQELDDYP